MERERLISIILIDDSELDLMIMYQAFKFTHINYLITPFNNYIDAIDSLNHGNVGIPDVIIIDSRTLHICKDSFLNCIKNDDRLKNIPIMILTSTGGEEICFSNMNLPVNCFIEKPFSISDITGFSEKVEHFWLSIGDLSSRLN